MKDLRVLFPRASAQFIAANEKVLREIAPDIPATAGKRAADRRVAVETKSFTPDPPKIPRRGIMNASEREFSFVLEAQKRNGDIWRWEFEGITLRWSGLAYTPDFVVFPSAIAVSGQIKLIEVKGNYIKGKFERAVERFRHAKTYYGDRFLFELHQRTRAGWKRLL